MRDPRRALTRTEILDRVWNQTLPVAQASSTCTSRISQKMDAGREPMSHTVRGVGHMLRPPA